MQAALQQTISLQGQTFMLETHITQLGRNMMLSVLASRSVWCPVGARVLPGFVPCLPRAVRLVPGSCPGSCPVCRELGSCSVRAGRLMLRSRQLGLCLGESPAHSNNRPPPSAIFPGKNILRIGYHESPAGCHFWLQAPTTGQIAATRPVADQKGEGIVRAHF